MARPPLPLNTWGKISRNRLEDGGWVALCRFRDIDGETRRVKAHGKTAAIAERRLIESLKERSLQGGEDIGPETRLKVVSAAWIREVSDSDKALSTKKMYTDYVRVHIDPKIGEIRLREATVPILDRFLQGVEKSSGHGAAKTCRVALNGMMTMATRVGAIPSNPVRDTRRAAQPSREVEAYDVEQVRKLRVDMRADKLAAEADLPDLVDILLATGVRIGEALALQWSEIDLGASIPTLTVSGTVVRGERGQMVRQNHGKSEAARRKLTLPPFAVEILLRRQVGQVDNPLNLVFPSGAGTLRQPNNARRSLRSAGDRLGYENLKFHTFRKTVATLVDQQTDTKSASSQLGHSSSRVTEQHYIRKTGEAPDLRDVIGTFDSRNGNEG